MSFQGTKSQRTPHRVRHKQNDAFDNRSVFAGEKFAVEHPKDKYHDKIEDNSSHRAIKHDEEPESGVSGIESNYYQTTRTLVSRDYYPLPHHQEYFNRYEASYRRLILINCAISVTQASSVLSHVANAPPIGAGFNLADLTDGVPNQKGGRPSHLPRVLINCALYGAPEQNLTLEEINIAIARRFSWYSDPKNFGWKELSRSPEFMTVKGTLGDGTYGSWWTRTSKKPPVIVTRARTVESQGRWKQGAESTPDPPDRKAFRSERPASHHGSRQHAGRYNSSPQPPGAACNPRQEGTPQPPPANVADYPTILHPIPFRPLPVRRLADLARSTYIPPSSNSSSHVPSHSTFFSMPPQTYVPTRNTPFLSSRASFHSPNQANVPPNAESFPPRTTHQPPSHILQQPAPPPRQDPYLHPYDLAHQQSYDHTTYSMSAYPNDIGTAAPGLEYA
ncbi:hypothetical protein BU17DRAFT_99208 [Hysterangium stoloniferum]|nr:hypothetical protein BU17DRAFT_99208 [Hysterangium stoloniferum]